MSDYLELEKILKHKFKNKQLLEEALTHPSLSYRTEKKFNYERLEFFGDAILAFLIIEYLFKKHPSEKEGELSKRKAQLVCTNSIATVAKTIHLDKYILMSKGEEKELGLENEKNLENAMEAIIGALYIDAGIKKTRQFVLTYWKDFDESFTKAPKDPKTELQEWTQKNKKGLPKYKLIKKEGSDHKPEFFIELKVEGLKSLIESGFSKKEVQKKLAEKMLKAIKSH
jgi:ribonuclease III